MILLSGWMLLELPGRNCEIQQSFGFSRDLDLDRWSMIDRCGWDKS
jgi:hypothetical protein